LGKNWSCRSPKGEEHMNEVEFLRRELERQLKAVDDLNKMVKDLSQITFESKMDKWLKASKAKEWVGLTDEEIKAFDTWHDNREEEIGWCNPSEIVAYIEAKLKEKNT